MAEEKLTDEVRAALEAQAAGTPPEVVEQQRAAREEWGTWVATQDIYFGGRLAVPKGEAVPAANVKLHRYDELGWVAKRDTKAAKAAATGEGN
jgi:hypothetical protein